MPEIDIQQISEQYFARIHRAALVLCGNPWDADDLAQETFLVLATQPEKFRGHSQIYTYLYGILLNLDRRERRRYGTRKRKLQVLWEREEPDSQTSPPAETPLEVAEWKKSLWAWVAKLPDGQRQVLVLRFSEGMTYEEIADTVQCPLGTVKSRIFHGLSGLKRLLEREGENAIEFPNFPAEDLIYAC